MLSAEAVLGQIRVQLGVLQAACRQLSDSLDFVTLLQAVLKLGNHLNEGTARGQADGACQLCSLG